MSNVFDDMRSAVQQARAVNSAVDTQVNALVDLLEGRLEQVSPYRLVLLKRALRRFNMQTKRWEAK
jgi:hypothetical protein